MKNLFLKIFTLVCISYVSVYPSYTKQTNNNNSGGETEYSVALMSYMTKRNGDCVGTSVALSSDGAILIESQSKDFSIKWKLLSIILMELQLLEAKDNNVELCLYNVQSSLPSKYIKIN